MAKIVSFHKNNNRLIAEVKKGNRIAQKELYEAYSPSVLSICRLYINDLHFAEDIMIKAFFKIFMKLPDYQEQNHFYAWIRRITVNECIDFLRSSVNKMTFSEWEDMDETYEDFNTKNIDTEYLQKFIDDLPFGCKMVFNLYVFEDFTHKEIAEELSISVGTSKSQLSYAKKILQEKLSKDYNYAR
ncbi:RNA polymerase sigma factor [Weeksellaceae bacterium TAE3-ERU29]|nr:RNA polymerase sigma factor [Weeksellaceae bacterium TAE3-ERU29]